MTEHKYSITTCEYIAVAALTAVMVAVPCAHYYCIVNYIPASFIARRIYLLALICCIACGLSVSQNSIKFSATDRVFSVLIPFAFISMALSPSPLAAFTGSTGRHEGLMMLLCYYIFFYTARFVFSEKGRSLLINCTLAVITVHAVYGLCQFFDIRTDMIFDSYHYAVSGVTGNPNFMGSLMVAGRGLAAGMMIYSPGLLQKSIYLCAAAINFCTLILTRTISAYAGTAVIFIALLILAVGDIYIKKGKSAAFVCGVVFSALCVLIYFILDNALYGLLTKELSAVAAQLADFVATGKADRNFASGRLVIWQNIWHMLPGNLFAGVGIDNLENAYHRYAGLLNGRFVDKAHNELLQILITMGLPVTLCYIAMYIFVFRAGLNRIKTAKNPPVDIALTIAFAGYLAQAMFNISVIDVAPYFWIIAGMLARPLIQKD